MNFLHSVAAVREPPVLDLVTDALHDLQRMHTSLGARRTAVAIAVGAIALSGCHDTKHSHAVTSNARRPDRFQVRPVLAITAAPCRAGYVPGRADQCYSLGAVALDARQVASATPSFQEGGDGWGVDLMPTADGLRRFNALAAQGFELPAPANEVALVVEGRVISAPALQTDHFSSNGVRVSGPLSKSDADHIAAVIR